jgi:RNA polymerase sigma-70 factor (TIGR02943 family)
MSDFPARVEALRQPLLRFARAQLRNDAWAEDAVSDTLLAALEKPQAFAGQSQLKTWLVGILKHKVIDQLRRHTREATLLSRDDDEDLDEQLFAPDGHWRQMPQDWGDPEGQLRQRQFFEVPAPAARRGSAVVQRHAGAQAARRRLLGQQGHVHEAAAHAGRRRSACIRP